MTQKGGDTYQVQLTIETFMNVPAPLAKYLSSNKLETPA